MEPLRIPHVGMRTFKTALATALCALVYYFVGRSPAFACIGVIFGMGYDLQDAKKNGGNRLFGTDRMIEALNRHKTESPQGILEGVGADVDEFVGGAPQFDDLTMLCLEIKEIPT